MCPHLLNTILLLFQPCPHHFHIFPCCCSIASLSQSHSIVHSHPGEVCIFSGIRKLTYNIGQSEPVILIEMCWQAKTFSSSNAFTYYVHLFNISIIKNSDVLSVFSSRHLKICERIYFIHRQIFHIHLTMAPESIYQQKLNIWTF